MAVEKTSDGNPTTHRAIKKMRPAKNLRGILRNDLGLVFSITIESGNGGLNKTNFYGL
jgi:hypothetical protein